MQTESHRQWVPLHKFPALNSKGIPISTKRLIFLSFSKEQKRTVG